MYCCWAELDPRLHDQSTNQRRHITEGRIVCQQCRASRVGFRWRDITIFIHASATWWRDFGANDEQQITIRATLFKLESELSPVDVIFLYKIIEWVGDLADRAQKVGGRLQMLVAR